MQKGHGLAQLLAEIPRLNAHAPLLLQSSFKEAAQANAGHLQGVLEGQEHACLRTLINRQFSNIFTVENNAATGDGVFGVAHQSIAQGGFTGAVGAHEHMGFAGFNIKIDAVQDLLVFHINLQIAHL